MAYRCRRRTVPGVRISLVSLQSVSMPTLKELANGPSTAASAAYSALMSTADIVKASATGLPAYDAVGEAASTIYPSVHDLSFTP